MNKKWISELALLFVAFVWGATFVVVQDAIQTVPPFSFNAVRFGLAGIFLLAVYMIKKRNRMAAVMPSVISGIVLGSCLFIGYTFQTVGLLYTTPSKAGFITGLSVVMVPLLAVLFLKKRPRLLSVIGSIAAALGLYLLAVKGAAALSAGDLLVFICTFGFAFHIILTDRFTKHVSVLLVTAVQVLSVSVFSFAGAIWTENWRNALSSHELFRPNLVFALSVTAFLATAAAFFIQTIAQRYTSPTRVAIILTMEPVFAALTSFVWLQERLSITAAAGCLLIFTGMVLSELPNLFHFKKGFFSESRSKG